MRDTITGDGVWKIKKRQGSSSIEVYKVEEDGTGNILSQEFLDWREGRTGTGDADGLKEPDGLASPVA